MRTPLAHVRGLGSAKKGTGEFVVRTSREGGQADVPGVAWFMTPIVVFLIFEPLGLYGIWVKVRNYWKRWPFSY